MEYTDSSLNTPEAPKRKTPWGRLLGRTAAMAGILLAELVLLVLVAVYGTGQLVAHGPSPYASGLLAGFFTETGVFKKGETFRFIANLFYTEQELSRYEQPQTPDAEPQDQVEILTFEKEQDPDGAPEATGPVADAWGLIDEDGDGLILEEVKGSGYQGYMLVILDPSRVIMGARPSSFGGKGYTVKNMVKHFNGVAGINAGGFEDEGGHGNGSTPNSLVVYDGKVYFESKGTQSGFAGFDKNHTLHVGKFTAQQIKELDIQYGASFGPVLIKDGEVGKGLKNSGVNPRTAIGQRSDGAVLMLVINGRQSTSIGATFQDLADVFQDYGAINACNMDGGSSSLLWYGDDYVNSSASLIGVRPVPSTFVVLGEGGSNEE